MKISAVIVHINRPILKRALECVRDADEIILIEEDQHNKKECITLYNEGVARSTGDAILVMWERMGIKPNWREKAMEGLEKIGGSGVVNFCECYFSAGVVTKDFIKNELGGYLWWPDYVHYCADIETADRARKVLKYVEYADMHLPTEPKADGENHSFNAIAFDEDTYRMRTNAGFPNIRMRTDKERGDIIKSMNI